MCRLLIHDFPVIALYVDDLALILVPFSFDLPHRLFAQFELGVERILFAFSETKDNVMVARESVYVALEFVVIPPDDFILKIVRPKASSRISLA